MMKSFAYSRGYVRACAGAKPAASMVMKNYRG